MMMMKKSLHKEIFYYIGLVELSKYKKKNHCVNSSFPHNAHTKHKNEKNFVKRKHNMKQQFWYYCLSKTSAKIHQTTRFYLFIQCKRQQTTAARGENMKLLLTLIHPTKKKSLLLLFICSLSFFLLLLCDVSLSNCDKRVRFISRYYNYVAIAAAAAAHEKKRAEKKLCLLHTARRDSLMVVYIK